MTDRPPITVTFKGITAPISLPTLREVMNGYGARMKDTHFTNIVKMVEEEVGPLEKVYDAASSWRPEDEIQPVWMMLDNLVEDVTVETSVHRVRPIDRKEFDVPGLEFVPTYALAAGVPKINSDDGSGHYNIGANLFRLPWDQPLRDTAMFPAVNIQGFVLAAPEGDIIVWLPGQIVWIDDVTSHNISICHERNLISGVQALTGRLDIERGMLDISIWVTASTIRIKGLIFSASVKQ